MTPELLAFDMKLKLFRGRFRGRRFGAEKEIKFQTSSRRRLGPRAPGQLFTSADRSGEVERFESASSIGGAVEESRRAFSIARMCTFECERGALIVGGLKRGKQSAPAPLFSRTPIHFSFRVYSRNFLIRAL